MSGEKIREFERLDVIKELKSRFLYTTKMSGEKIREFERLDVIKELKTSRLNRFKKFPINVLKKFKVLF